MIFDIETRDQYVTLNQVTLTIRLDEETCFTLASVFSDLGEALFLARMSYKGRKRWEAGELERRRTKKAMAASVEASYAKFKGLPYTKQISAVARELEITYDEAYYRLQDVRRAERRKAALRRDEEVMRLSKSGQTAKAIAERLELAPGTVRNILTRIRKETLRPAGVKALGA